MVMAGNELDAQATLLPQKSVKGFPTGLGLLMFFLLSFLTFGLITNFLPPLSMQIALVTGFLVGLAGGIVTYRRAATAAGALLRRRARAAQEMQANRAAETEKQITEMKRKIAEAEGSE